MIKMLSNEIVVDYVKPEWFRRELAEAVANGEKVTLQIFHGDRFCNEYPVVLKDRNNEVVNTKKQEQNTTWANNVKNLLSNVPTPTMRKIKNWFV